MIIAPQDTITPKQPTCNDDGNTTLYIPKVVGSINISHHVDCPHCGETMYDDIDREWWNANITDQLPNVEEYRSQFETKCIECGLSFIIDGFEY